MGSTFGTLFTISTWGESHGGGIGVVIDGCPPGMPLSVEEIQVELDRRRPGQSDLVTPRKEADRATVLSGIYQGRTLGTPIAISIPNEDQRPSAYDEMRDKFRPSHADFTYQAKYGIRNPEGGGRSSARETAGRVAAGAVAAKVLRLSHGIEIVAFVESVQDIRMPAPEGFPTRAEVDANAVRCPHAETADRMAERIREVRSEGDSVGGVVRCLVRGLPVGLGDPVFDRLEADLGKAMLSIPASKGFEIGSGFAGTLMRGSAHNDRFVDKGGRIGTETNRSGGVQGGISNGEALDFRVAFKPTATILRPQMTVDLHGKEVELAAKGRHDPCVLPRAVPVVEAMAACVLLDHLMRHLAQCRSFNFKT